MEGASPRWFARMLSAMGAAALVATLCAVSLTPVCAQTPIGTAFTYQGSIDQSGGPLSGTADFQFKLFGAVTGGTQVGTTQSVTNLTVTDGVFTTVLDFGASVFTGDKRFLEIAVRTPSGSGSFTTLSPRQELTSTPYALKARGVDGHSLDAADGSPVDQVFVDANGNVGIGTTTPTARLEVSGGPMQVNNSGDQADLLWLASERSWVFRQEGTGAATALKLQSQGGGGNKNFLIETTGLVGIGTLTPQAKLDVNGTTRTTVLEIVGADLAERFPSSDEAVAPGTVMEIDPDNAGHLRVARSAYSRCVAGVVSGANDFAAGAVLGNLPGHEEAPPIALSGRVYVRCDTSGGAIHPGDLLTTSDAPGVARRASDPNRSHGAIIGKAMEELIEGSGLILVLVNLQ